MANGAAASGPADPADGQVTVPPAGPQRLPIFDSLESDWFRRSGNTLTSTQRAQGGQAAQPARPGFVDIARRRGLARRSGGGIARGGRNYPSGAAKAGSEG